MVPGSTLRYGSSFWIVTLRPRPSSRLAIDADARPFPNEETTPPVTKMNFVCLVPRTGAVIAAPPASAAASSQPARSAPEPESAKIHRAFSTRAAILSGGCLEVNARRADSHHRG